MLPDTDDSDLAFRHRSGPAQATRIVDRVAATRHQRDIIAIEPFLLANGMK